MEWGVLGGGTRRNETSKRDAFRQGTRRNGASWRDAFRQQRGPGGMGGVQGREPGSTGPPTGEDAVTMRERIDLGGRIVHSYTVRPSRLGREGMGCPGGRSRRNHAFRGVYFFCGDIFKSFQNLTQDFQRVRFEVRRRKSSNLSGWCGGGCRAHISIAILRGLESLSFALRSVRWLAPHTPPPAC